VTLQVAVTDVYSNVLALHEELNGLRTMIVEDRPLESDLALIDLFGEMIDDLLGRLEEAIVAVTEAQRASCAPIDLDIVNRAIGLSQEHLSQVSQRFMFELSSYERMSELWRVGRERGGEWWSWSGAVRAAIGSCQQPLFQAQQAYIRCWQELVNQASLPSLAVRMA
jgi:hypothetical protein